MGLGVPCIGLGCYRQIHKLYEELGRSDECIDVSKPGFAGPLGARISQTLHASGSIHAKTQAQVLGQRRILKTHTQDWAHKKFLVGLECQMPSGEFLSVRFDRLLTIGTTFTLACK